MRRIKTICKLMYTNVINWKLQIREIKFKTNISCFNSYENFVEVFQKYFTCKS